MSDDTTSEGPSGIVGAPEVPPGIASPIAAVSRVISFGRLADLGFRHPCLVAIGLGVLAACGFQPLALWALTLVGVAGLVALIQAAPNGRRALLLGWLWGVGHFTLGLNWIATAFTYQAKMPVWLGWCAVVGLSLYLAVFPAVAALGGWLFRRSKGALVLGFAGCWIITEWLRSWVFTGFAWNPLGVVLLGGFDHPGLGTLSPLLGTYGLSGLTCLLACGLAELCRPTSRDWPPPSKAGVCLILVVWLGLAMPMYFGFARRTGQGHIPYTLVQPNIAQDGLDDPAQYEAHFETTAALSHPATSPTPRLVLWPESGTQEYLRDGYPAWVYADGTYGGDPVLARQRLAQTIGANSLLLTGAVDLVPAPAGDRIMAARNVVTALDGQGRVVGSYAKAHLVPYGEYLPMRWLLQPLGLARLVPGDLDFWPGPGPQTLDLGRYGKAGVQICYEIVFSGQVVDRARRPDYIFNPSNDGWFGDWYPPQILAQARLRAVEEGLPVLRSTTNGDSAVIDADGIVRQFAARGVAARLDGLVPPAHAPTLFARLGNILPLGWAMAILGLAMLVLWRRRG